jgi:hypothetical protein
MQGQHSEIERRSRLLARAVVAKIDEDPERVGLSKARALCALWCVQRPNPYLQQWRDILQGEWQEVRDWLMSDTPEARELRQNSPFCGVLSPSERWQIYRDAKN